MSQSELPWGGQGDPEELIHRRIHQGRMFTIDESFNALTSGDSINVLLSWPNQGNPSDALHSVHAIWALAVGGTSHISIWQNPVLVGSPSSLFNFMDGPNGIGGSQNTAGGGANAFEVYGRSPSGFNITGPINMNRASTRVSKTAAAAIADADISDPGSRLKGNEIPSNIFWQPGAPYRELILVPANTYLFRLENTSGSASAVTLDMMWYELEEPE